MESLIVAIHIVVALAIVGLVLIQQGKGADMGASFGSGASQTIFGSAGSGNVLTRSTTWLAIAFFVTSLSLAVLARNRSAAGIEEEALLSNPEAAAAESAQPVALPDLAADAAVVPADIAAPATSAAASTDAPSSEAAVVVDTAVEQSATETVEQDPQTTQN
jgi:preprotein translocase subunit SecG